MTPSERHQRLTQIFIAVCHHGGEKRRETLDRLCGEYPELRSEIELLLSFHDSVAGASRRPPDRRPS